MWKYFLIILSSFFLAILQISFIPNFVIMNGMVLLPIIAIVYKFTLNQSPGKKIEIYLFSLSLGLFLDLFSGGRLLSFTIVLFIFTILLTLLKRVSFVENHLVFANLALILGVFCYDVFFMFLNGIVQINKGAVLAFVFDLVLTTLAFWIIILTTSRFHNRHRRLEIKLQ